jgi:hypothetical protein
VVGMPMRGHDRVQLAARAHAELTAADP